LDLDKLSFTIVSGFDRTASGALCELVYELQFGVRCFQNGRQLRVTRVNVICWTILRLRQVNSVMWRTLKLNFTHISHYTYMGSTDIKVSTSLSKADSIPDGVIEIFH